MLATLFLGFTLFISSSIYAQTPSVSETQAQGAPSATATPPISITPEEKKKMIKEFKTVTSEEMTVFDHREKTAAKDLSSAQSIHAKKWRDQERKTRRAYFAEHTHGPDRRNYVQEYQQRLREFDQSLKEETANSKAMWKQKREDLKSSQKEREIRFKSAMDQNQQPDDSVWRSKDFKIVR